jgi:acyl-CoA thioester hydrolase
MIAALESYPIQLVQDVLWGDLDAYGHVNNTVYFRYFEDSRMAFFEQAGVGEIKQSSNLGPILAHAECNFRLPLQYPDRIRIAGRARLLAPKKIQMDCLVYSEAMNGIAAELQGLLLYYDYNVGRTCEVPEAIAKVIGQLESNR